MYTRIKAVTEADLRMLGNLAHNIQRVLPVTQADIDAAAALGKGWVVWKVVEVTDPLDNCRGGTQLVIKQNSIQPGQNVRRVLIVSGPSGQVVVIGPDKSPLLLPDAVADSLQYLKAYGDCENRNLPEGYQELAYIEGTSNVQYINTGIIPTSSMNYYFKCSALEGTSGSFSAFGSRASNGGNDGVGFFIGSGSNTRIDSIFFTASGTEYRWQVNNVNTSGDIYETTFKNGLQEIIKNGTSLGTNQYTPTTTCDQPLYVGGLNNGGTIQAGQWTYRMYRFTIQGISDMIPAKRLADGAIGMWDKIRKQFYTNAGTGEFVAGTPLNVLPDGYTQIEYIEGTNNLTYIDTDIVPNSSMEMYFKGQFVSVDASTPTQVAFFLGARDVSAISGIFFQEASATTSLDFFQAGTRWANSHTRAANDIVELKVKNALAQIFINGSSIGTNQFTTDETTQYPLFLNALNSVGQPFSSNVNVVNRVYRFTITGVCDMVPAKRNSDGVLGMYDIIRNRFFTKANASSPDFVAGNVVTPTPTTPQDIWCNNGAIKAIRPIKYLESTGTQYIDTGVVPKVGMKVEYEYSTPDIPSSNKFLFGSRSSGTYETSTDQFYMAILNTAKEQLISGVDRTIIRDYQPNVDYTTIATNSFATANGTYNIILFGVNIIGSIVCSGSKRIKSFKIYDNNTLIRDFIPALDANNIPCMYDKVEGKCYYNAGTGQFIAGYLPAEYEELDYIQGYTGNSSVDPSIKAAYIDTGLIFDTTVNMYYKGGIGGFNNNSVLAFGVRPNNAYSGISSYFSGADVVTDWGGTDASGRWTLPLALISGDTFEVSTYDKTMTISKNGVVAGTNTFTGTATNNLTFYLNSRHDTGGAPSQSSPSIGRLYRFTVAGVCDMIPARKRSNGHIGMYDLIRRQFFESAGEGQFTFGKLPILPETYTQLEYLESTGTQWLETGVSIAGGCVIEAKAKVIENQFLIGSQVSGQPDTTRCRVYFDGVNQGLLAQKLNVTATLAPIADTSQPFEFKMDTIGTGFYFYVNGSLIYSNASSGTIGSQTNNGIKIAYNNATGTAYKQTVYWVKLYNSDNTLVRYLIPARRESDGVVGMYDIMNDVLLTNQGTGDFITGSDIPAEPTTYYTIDGTVEKVGIHSADNKNLFNGVFEQGGIYQGNRVNANTRIRTPNPFSLAAGTYTVSCASDYEIWVEINGASGVTWTATKTITVSATNKIMIAVRNKTNPSTTPITPDEAVNVQVEAGSTATTYSPYYDGDLATCENLFGIGTTQDVQELLAGDVTRKVGIFMLTGEEWWEKLNFADKSVFRAKVVIPDDRYSNPENNIGLCSHFTVIPTSASVTSLMNNLELAWNTNSLMCIRYDSMSTLNDFLAFLRSQYDAGTPVTIVYPLASEVSETVAGQTLTVAAGDNTAEIMQASIDDLLIEAKYTKSV